MIHPGGFLSNAAFHADGDARTPPVIDTLAAVLQRQQPGRDHGRRADRDRAGLHPGGARRAGDELLGPAQPRRSTSTSYALFFNPAYPDELKQPLVLSLIQMLWDRGEPNGYAHRMTTNPLPNTPPHEVLMDVAFGDHQVTTWQADVEARTIGAQVHDPVVYDGRWPDVDVAWGVPRIASLSVSRARRSSTGTAARCGRPDPATRR